MPKRTKYLSKFTINEDSSIIDSLKMINKNQRGFLVVVDALNRPVGVTTDGDIRRAIIDGKGLEEKIESIMSRKFNFLKGELNFHLIAETFNNNPINFIPIIDTSKKLVDIVTKEQFEASVLSDKPLGGKMKSEKGIVEALSHQIVPKPWGYYKTTLLTPYYQSKILCINPKQAISLQSHKYREEHWVNIKGAGEVIIEASTKKFESGDYVFIPRGCKHRLINTSKKENLIVNEVQLGTNFDENDIIRYEDKYER